MLHFGQNPLSGITCFRFPIFEKMNVTGLIAVLLIVLFAAGCSPARKTAGGKTTIPAPVVTPDPNPVHPQPDVPGSAILHDVNREEFISYAKEFLGTRYLYASADPAKGFDCSGFLFYVFKHFNIKSPRSSYEFEHWGTDIDLAMAQPGDLILFTASDSGRIGHIGILTDQGSELRFIHASSSRGVIISRFAGYYLDHFVKMIRVLK
jgi:cell wall-associated NlpC family hydrolase